MSGKKLNTEAITSELAGSAFFPMKPVNNRRTDVPSESPTAAAHAGPTDRKPHVAAAKPVPNPLVNRKAQHAHMSAGPSIFTRTRWRT